ncbi:unnamed protein product, partial [Heterosigma akashiwo]
GAGEPAVPGRVGRRGARAGLAHGGDLLLGCSSRGRRWASPRCSGWLVAMKDVLMK